MTIDEQIRAVQRELGLDDDGIAGRLTWAAIHEAIVGPVPEPSPLPTDRVDERSEKNIATLHPRVQPLARQLVREAAAAGITIKIIDGSRTYAQQDALYAKGRTSPGPIVTNARGGYSWHNFALAMDIGIFEGSDYIEESPQYDAVGEIGKRLGFEWGGDWSGSLVDKPHFQFNPLKLSLAQLRQRTEDGLPVV